MSNPIVIFSTAGSEQEASKIAEHLSHEPVGGMCEHCAFDSICVPLERRNKHRQRSFDDY